MFTSMPLCTFLHKAADRLAGTYLDKGIDTVCQHIPYGILQQYAV